MTDLTIQPALYGRAIIRKSGVIVADITPSASPPGLTVHYFGATKSRIPMPTLCPDMEHAREIIKMAAAS